MNGQHSSMMLSKLDEPFPEHLFAHIDEYVVESPEDMALLFRQFDPRESARSVRDVAHAYQETYPELSDIPHDSAKLGADGIAWYLNRIEGIPTGKGDDKYAYVFRRPVYYDFLHWIGTLMTMKTPELKKIEVVASMYAIHVSSPEAFSAFWEQVARGGDQYKFDHPTTVLDAWLKLCKEGKCEDKMKQAYHYQGCNYAWNAYREGKSIKEIRFSTAKGLYTPLP
jgi:hypothetical protein